MKLMRRFTPSFTITEVLIAGALVTIVSGVVGQVFVFNAQVLERSQNVTGAQDNLRYVLNVLDKELRTAPAGSISVSGGELSFTNQRGTDITYRVNNKVLEKVHGGDVWKVTKRQALSVENLSFKVSGAESDEAEPTKVTSLVNAKIKGSDPASGQDLPPIRVQTTTVLRNVNKDFLD